MKKIIEDTNEGLLALLGEDVVVWCLNYIYTGKLVGVNDHDIKLEAASVVYETGPLSEASFKDAQALLPKYWYVRLATVESYGLAR